MKGFLLLSLCLLLVISGSSSQSSTSPSSSSVGPSPSTSSSSQITVTSQTSGGPGSSSVGPTPSTGSSSQTTVTSQTSGGPGSSSVGPTPSTGSSSQTSGGPGSSSVGPTPFTGSSSQTSGGASSSTVTSTGPSDPCQPNPCQGSASCVKLHNSSFCLCVEGYYYNESSSPSCVKGKTFPGEISMDVSETDGLDDENSENYQKLHNDVVDFFATVFSKTDYGQTVILKVGTAPSMSARSAIPVYVSLVNMFREDTDEIEYTVSLAIHNAIENNDNVKSYFSQNLCDYYGCVRNGSSCEDGLQCTCKPGFDRLKPQVPFCVAVPCSESCNAKDKKQCIRKDNGAMECVCMPDYQKASGNGNCEECPFGYSGMDCKDPFQLILTIVGTVAGALILILLIACIVSVRSKNKKKDVEEQKLIEDDFQNLRLRQTGFSNYGADNSIFPKVRTGVTSQTPNPYTNQRSMPRPDY